MLLSIDEVIAFISDIAETEMKAIVASDDALGVTVSGHLVSAYDTTVSKEPMKAGSLQSSSRDNLSHSVF